MARRARAPGSARARRWRHRADQRLARTGYDVTVLAIAGSSTLWYVARGSALAALIVLTLSTVLGIVTSVRWSNSRWPRFVIELLHRNSSLLALALIVVHVAAVVIDAFAPIGWKDTVIPFVSVYRPVWLGLGAVAFDVLLALVVTSVLRHRMSHRAWRFVHWFAYLCWPLVVVHGLATGSDTRVGAVLVLYIVCVAAVLVAGWWRLAVASGHAGVRIAGVTASFVAPIVLVVWLTAGPLAAGWARRAGTPPGILAQLASTPAVASVVPSAPARSGPSGSSSALPAAPFSAQVVGSISQSDPAADGRITIRLATSFRGSATGVLDVELVGKPVQGGGVLLDTSRVTMGPNSQPSLYRGAVVALQGDQIVADLQSPGRAPLELIIAVQIDSNTNRVAGSLRAQTGRPASTIASGGGG